MPWNVEGMEGIARVTEKTECLAFQILISYYKNAETRICYF